MGADQPYPDSPNLLGDLKSRQTSLNITGSGWQERLGFFDNHFPYLEKFNFLFLILLWVLQLFSQNFPKWEQTVFIVEKCSCLLMNASPTATKICTSCGIIKLIMSDWTADDRPISNKVMKSQSFIIKQYSNRNMLMNEKREDETCKVSVWSYETLKSSAAKSFEPHVSLKLDCDR